MIQVPSMNDLTEQWRSWIANPENRTAMLQFGLSLMQPIGAGQTPAGHVAQAIGEAGAAVGRRREQELRELSAGSKAELQQAQIQSLAERARAEQEKLGLARERLGVERENLALKRLLGLLKSDAEYRKRFNEEKMLNPDLTEQEFVQRFPRVVLPIVQRILAEDLASQPSEEKTVPPSGAGAGEEAPRAPRDKSQLVPGKVYTTWDGKRRVIWTGAEWIPADR